MQIFMHVTIYSLIALCSANERTPLISESRLAHVTISTLIQQHPTKQSQSQEEYRTEITLEVYSSRPRSSQEEPV